MKRFILLNLLIVCHFSILGQANKNDKDSVTWGENRKIWAAGAVTGGVYVGSMTTLYHAWYRNYDFETFHFFNDLPEWKGIDKIGHATTAWWASQWLYSGQMQLGITRGDPALRAAIIPLCFLTTIEVFDGFSSGWGFSLSDMGANLSGAGLFYIQQRVWNEQRFLLHYSYHATSYAALRPEILGSTPAERFLKDYNGQTYWLSYPIHRKGWFCLSLGYGASGMLGGRDNIWLSDGGIQDYSLEERYSNWTLSLDVDLMKLPIRGRAWKWFASSFRWLKIPAPALQWSRPEGFKALPFYF